MPRRAAVSETAKPSRASPAAKSVQRQRLDPADRAKTIADAAAALFAEKGFEGQTRELAARLGITQPLLYRYFPSKDALIERVCRDIFIDRWNPRWEQLVVDRRLPLRERLITFYQAYAAAILTYEWVRLFMFAGLRQLDLNARYLDFLKQRLFGRVIGELRHDFGRPPLREMPVTSMEIEMVWGLHAKIFYLGVRRFIYNMPLDDDINSIIGAHVLNFLDGIAANLPQGATASVKSRTLRAGRRN
ncbi:helix-turn-helix domain-containing protein [Bradyrhizobium prioriisuperbiae]|uniref:TetR/AcrR family transcriptional regulator n=1 Tax=Bradyrhizobium prioriisuperbiae TaxID=2854389 RepID=UPI0028EE5A26|nr:helix-turn-helix domain-containing protein [Bradyrhizobium prioritasuperba]